MNQRSIAILTLACIITPCLAAEIVDSASGVKHLEVVYLVPGKTILLHGALGPLASIAATGSMEIKFTPAGDATKLDMLYTVAGYLPAGMNTWAAPVDSMLKEQFTRLKNYIEHGDPAPK